MNIEKRWVKMISMAALLLIVVSACDSDEDVESGDEGLYPGRIVDVNLQLDPLWIYEYTNRVREKVNICTGNDDNNTPGWQPGDEVIVNCTLILLITSLQLMPYILKLRVEYINGSWIPNDNYVSNGRWLLMELAGVYPLMILN